MKKMKLIIFDLDQTIVEPFRFHNAATTATFKQVFNVKAKLDEIEFAGGTLRHNIEELAKLKGIGKKEIKKKSLKAINTYGKIFNSMLPKNFQKIILPGAIGLIKKLHKNKNNFLVIVTGDSHLITKEVLKRAGLLRYFKFFITGEKEKNRAKLVKQAVLKAKKKAQIEKIIVIGDSIRDVDSGKVVNATTIAVLTGFHSKSLLKKTGADYIFKNLTDKKIIQIIGK